MERIACHVEEVRRFVAQRVANTSDSEDIAQQTLCVACEKIDTFRNGNLKAWLLTIARHLVVDHYRRQHRFQFLEVDSTVQSEAEAALRTGHEEVQDRCDHRDRLRCYLCLTEHLRVEEQTAVLMADLFGYRDKESAAAMGLSLPTFKLLLHNARCRMRQAKDGACSLVRRDSPLAAANQRCPDSRKASKNSATASDVGEEPCDMGVKCCRLVPKFGAIRQKLLETLRTGLAFWILVAMGETPELSVYAGGEAISSLLVLL